MSVYRITSWTSSDEEKTLVMLESMRGELESVGAEFIDIVSYGNGNGATVAKHTDSASMDAATAVSRNVFGRMVEAGLIDGNSIQ